MPYPTGIASDVNALPSIINAQLTADVAITPVNTSVDIVTFGTVQPGTYLVSGQAVLAQVTNTAVTTLVFLLGGTPVKAVECTFIVGAGYVTIPTFPLVIGVAAVLKMAAFSTVVTTTAKKVALNNGTGTDNFVTGASLIRIA